MSDQMNDRDFLLKEAQRIEQEAQSENKDRDYLNNLADEMDESRRGLLKDTGVGLMRAPSEFSRSILDGLADIDEWLGRKTGAIDVNPFDGDGIGIDEWNDEVHASPFRIVEQEVKEGLDMLPQTERFSGQLVEDGAKWAGWFVGAGKTKLLKLISNPWGRAAAAGAVADFAAFDEHEERLSDLLIQSDNGIANNILTQWLASDENDEWYEGRFKNAIEGGILGAATDGIIMGVRALRSARVAQREAREAARLDADEALIEQRMKNADENPFVADAAREVDEPTVRVEDADNRVAIEVADDVDTMAQKIETNLGGKTTRIAEILTEVVETGDVDLLLRELGDTINLRNVPADELSEMALKLGQAVFRMAEKDPKFSRETVEHWLTNGSRNLSDNLGVDVARLYTDMAEGGGNASRLVGTLIGLSDSMSRLAKDINVARAEAVSPRAVDEAMVQLEQLQYFSALAAGNSSAAGRALRSLRETKERLLKGVEDLKSEAEKLDDLEAKRKVLKAVEQFAREHNLRGTLGAARRAGWHRAEDALRQVGYGNMLSALSTHKANTLGNAIRWAQGMLNAPLSYIGGRIRFAGNKVLRRNTENMDFTSWDEVVGYWAGAKTGWDQSVRGTAHLISRAMDAVNPFVSTEQSLKEWAEESAELGNLWKTVITGSPVTDNLTRIGDRPLRESFTAESLFEGQKWFEEGPRYVKSLLSAIIDTTGKVYSVPTRVIVAVDELFKTVAFEQHVTMKSYADFAGDIRAGKLDVSEAAQIIHENQARAKSSRSIYNDAVDFAREQTFQKELPGFLGKFEATVQAIPMGWLVVPFIRTPTNLFKGAVETLGVTPLMRAVGGPAGKERDRAIGQLIVGTGFTLTAVSLAMDDRLRGGDRTGDGIEPYSIRIGDKWYTFNRLDPLGMALGLVADAVDGARNLDTAPEADHWTLQSLGIAASAVSQNLISKTWLRGLTDFLEAATENDPDQAANKWSRFMAQAGTNLLPFIGSNLERREAVEQDEFSRYVFNVVDQLKQRSVSDSFGIGVIVGNRQSLGIRRDVLGRPIAETSGRDTVVNASEGSPNLVDHVLADYGESWPEPARSFEKGQVRMDTNQYSRYMELRGQVVEIGGMNLEQRLEGMLLRNDRFANLPTDVQIDEIRGWFRQYQTVAKAELLKEYPDLQDRINATKQFEVDKYRSDTAVEADEAQATLNALLDPSASLTGKQQEQVQDVLSALTQQ